MSVLENIEIQSLTQTQQESQNLKISTQKIRDDINKGFWKWYDEHADDEVFSISLLIIHIKKIRVKDLHRFFILLFGNRKEGV